MPNESPIGSIIAFAGLDTPALEASGWMLCDGRALPRTGATKPLYDAIKTFHGEGDGVNTFNIPDLRGAFLRGVSQNSNRDPDAGNRQPAAPGGNSGNAVGSVQACATQLPRSSFHSDTAPDHTHSFTAVVSTPKNGADEGYFWIVNPAGPSTTSPAGAHSHAITGGGDSETRPLNAYVIWIIRYK